MLKITVGLGYPTFEIFVYGDKKDDLIDQLEFTILELNAPVTKWTPDELEEDEFEDLIALNGGEYYIESAYRELVEDAVLEDLFEELPDTKEAEEFIKKYQNEDFDLINEEELLTDYYAVINNTK